MNRIRMKKTFGGDILPSNVSSMLGFKSSTPETPVNEPALEPEKIQEPPEPERTPEPKPEKTPEPESTGGVKRKRKSKIRA